ncbi:MAG: MerR family regulatory protein [Verrucomicrobiales bacterium]|nr:MerR family regulatory protein [Verrucomicrobiales bacterium]
MTSDASSAFPSAAAYAGGEGEYFSLEVFASLAGVSTRTVLHYQEQGFIRPASLPAPEPAAPEKQRFDTESLRQLRRIEHLRETCGMNDSGLRLILSLLHEVEQLRQERRQIRR